MCSTPPGSIQVSREYPQYPTHMKRINVHLEDQTVRTLKATATANGMTLSALVRHLVALGIKNGGSR